MLVASYRNTEAGISERTATARAEEYWRRKRYQERQQEEELAKLAARELRQQQALEQTRALRAELSAKLGKVILPRITYAEIERRACKVFKCKRADIKGNRRNREIVIARQFIAYWAVRRTSLALAQIGRLMDRDHSTVLHSKGVYAKKRAAMGRTLRQVR